MTSNALHRLIIPCLIVASLLCGRPANAQPGTSIENAIPIQLGSRLGHVEIQGSGPIDMILIPGLYVDWTVWDSFMKRNATRYTMYAVTLPGFGGTNAPAVRAGQKFSDQTWIRNAEARIVEIIRLKKLNKPVIVGHDLGARIAMRIGINNPGLVSRIVNIDALPAMPIPGRPDEVGTSQEYRDYFVNEIMAPEMEKLPELPWQTSVRESYKGQMANERRAEIMGSQAGTVPKVIAQRYFLELAASDDENEVYDIKVPLLILAANPALDANLGRWGVVPANWKKVQDRAAKSNTITFAVINDSDHYVTEDQPEVLDRILDQYIKGQPIQNNRPRHLEKGAAGTG